jgi:hypothetical protein
VLRGDRAHAFAAGAVLLGVAGLVPAAQNPELEPILQRAGVYLAKYERDMTRWSRRKRTSSASLLKAASGG